MIYKGQSKFRDKKITEHFKVGEIACKDGSATYTINSEVLEILEEIRAIAKKPVIINSGYRTPEYNKKVGGSPRSQHVLGNAVDFRISGMTTQDIYELIKANKLIGTKIKGLGLYNSFVHIDVRPNPHPRGYSFWDNRK